jgi:hypothetical protein
MHVTRSTGGALGKVPRPQHQSLVTNLMQASLALTTPVEELDSAVTPSARVRTATSCTACDHEPLHVAAPQSICHCLQTQLSGRTRRDDQPLEQSPNTLLCTITSGHIPGHKKQTLLHGLGANHAMVRLTSDLTSTHHAQTPFQSIRCT